MRCRTDCRLDVIQKLAVDNPLATYPRLKETLA